MTIADGKLKLELTQDEKENVCTASSPHLFVPESNERGRALCRIDGRWCHKEERYKNRRRKHGETGKQQLLADEDLSMKSGEKRDEKSPTNDENEEEEGRNTKEELWRTKKRTKRNTGKEKEKTSVLEKNDGEEGLLT